MRGGGFAHVRERDSSAGDVDVADRRTWWVQFEALRALAVLAHDDGSAASTDALRAHWTFIRRRMLDHANGGVFDTCPADLRPWERRARRSATSKGHEWKDASHETHALLSTIAILRWFRLQALRRRSPAEALAGQRSTVVNETWPHPPYTAAVTSHVAACTTRIGWRRAR